MREYTVAHNSAYINKLAQLRQEWEAYFALQVYNVFNQGEPLRKLQGVAATLLDFMVNQTMRQPDPVALAAGTADAGIDRFWGRGNVQPTDFRGIFNLKNRSPLMDASDCADVIRLVGTWLEKGHWLLGTALEPNPAKPVHQAQNLLADDLRLAYRAGDTRGTANRVNAPHMPITPPAEVWGPGARPKVRIVDGQAPIEPHIKKYMPYAAARTGMTGRRAADTSVVKAMDRLFDLIAGVEISGTTADCTFDLELANNLLLANKPNEQLSVSAANMLHVAYYLVPLGTIAANMHHTLLEVALTLSFDEIMDYHVGFFKSLTPRRLENWPAALATIPHAMDNADDHMVSQGLHYFCYYIGGAKTGIFQLQPEEVPKWQVSRTSSARVLHRWARAHQYPSRHDVSDLLRLAGLHTPQ